MVPGEKNLAQIEHEAVENDGSDTEVYINFALAREQAINER